MANLLQARELTTLPLFSDIDLDIEEGEGLVLAGASGSGKSKLLRLLAGADRITSGEMAWAAHTRIELVGATALRPRLTVQAHLNQALKKLVPLRIAEAVELFELETCLTHKASALSAGERARVVLACALIRRPSIWLLDEPWQLLDAPIRARFRAKLLELKRETACAWLIATQDPADFMGIADRILVLEGGKITQNEAPPQFYLDPATRQAGALAGMNFIEGRLDVRDGERFFAFACGETEGVLPLSYLASVPEVPGAEHGRGSIVLGIRSEFVRVARTPEAFTGVEVERAAIPAEKVLPGWEALSAAEAGSVLSREEALSLGYSGRKLRHVARVRSVEWLGRETRITLELGGQDGWVWVTRENINLKSGERVWVELDRARLFWFDAQGARLRLSPVQEAPEPLPILALEDDPHTRGLKTGREDAGRDLAKNRDEEAAAE